MIVGYNILLNNKFQIRPAYYFQSVINQRDLREKKEKGRKTEDGRLLILSQWANELIVEWISVMRICEYLNQRDLREKKPKAKG